MKSRTEVKRTNQTAFFLIFVALVLAIIFMLFPAYEFDVNLYTKKSLDTVVGDDTYNEIVADAQSVMTKLASEGYTVEYSEDATSKTNTSGKVSNIVTITLKTSFMKSALAFFGAGLTSSYILLAIMLCVILGIGCLLCGTAGSLDDIWSLLTVRQRAFRNTGCVMFLIALLLVPVFFMTNTYTMSREVYLYANSLKDMTNSAAFYEKMDYLLFGGTAGDNIATYLKGMSFKSTPWMWMVMPCIFVMCIGALQIRYGKVKKGLTKALLYTFIIIVCIITLYPYYVMFVTAFRSSAETNDMYFLHIFPTTWVWSNLKNIVSRGVMRYLLNSLLIAAGATLIALLCGIPAAYAMARMRFKGKKAFLGFVIMSQMFSPVVLLIGISQLISSMGLNDSIVGLMLINAAFNQAFAIWLLRGTFVSISPEMEEAGRIDGCTTLGSMWHILLPMAAPGIVTTLIFVFINAWNEYTISTVLISTATNRPITVGITQFSSFNMIEWQYLFAASLLATIPVVILFMCIEKHLTSGLTSGGVKG